MMTATVTSTEARRNVLRHRRNAGVVLAEVGGVDLDRRIVECRTWEPSYDSLVFRPAR